VGKPRLDLCRQLLLLHPLPHVLDELAHRGGEEVFGAHHCDRVGVAPQELEHLRISHDELEVRVVGVVDALLEADAGL